MFLGVSPQLHEVFAGKPIGVMKRLFQKSVFQNHGDIQLFAVLARVVV